MIHLIMRSAICMMAGTGLAFAGAPAPVAATPPDVVVTGGEISGFAADGITKYLGIPFAAPTGGEARFSPPRPAPPWPGIRQAHGHGPQCSQTGLLPDPLPTGPTSEDCLTIDLYVPDGTRDRNLPVMVFFHGGGYTDGSNSQYDAPTRMVAEGNVIVAIPNYRLGPFGFMSLPELAAESGGATGTAGIQDQQAALRWVHDNAHAFGGDPSNVTIFGESAGAGSICTHFAAPASDGLYNKAIIQSGSCVRSSLMPRNRDDSFTRSQQYAESVGCGDPATQLACLRALPAAKLLESPIAQFDGLPTWIPSIDGVVVTGTLDTALARAADRKIPLIVGNNSNEGALFIVDSDFAHGRIPDAASYERYVRRSFGTYADRVLAQYPVDRYPSPAAAQSAVITDGVFACPALFVSRVARDTGHPVWQYEFDEAPFGDANPLLPGAFHAGELPYLFTSLMSLPIPWTGPSGAFARQMQRWWTTFAHTGNPNGPGSPPWSAWPEPTEQSFDGPVLTMRATGSTMSHDFAAEHHCEFWSERPQ
ncbi:carboxylesterase/lipase family protein [Nocardia sp. NBC_01009]|uniref:carboxylesterase/lipase family protein n=1 Tax=Nocardia sp. NBC_01009 TaxID=2975996 RepID=UPI00386AFCCD|nr:carboxylesterase family protein [Nocardia sp. NBC_01009]